MTTNPVSRNAESIHREHAIVPDQIGDHLSDVVAACQRYGVRTLWLFGSAVRGTFDPETSDLDFLVDLGEYEPTVAERYGGLYMTLQDLFARRIDLVTIRSTRNSAVLDHIEQTWLVLYAA